MAGQPAHPKWDLVNWSSGDDGVTLFEALGIGKGKIKFPKLQTILTSPAAKSAPAPSTSTAGGGGGGSSGGNTVAPSSTSESDWIKAMLSSLGAPQTPANVNSVAAWIRHESPWNASPPDGALYTNNPLNTTLPLPGAVSFNADGVKRYPTSKIGIQATVSTLLGGYPTIVARLKSGKGICGASGDFSKWSAGGYDSVC